MRKIFLTICLLLCASIGSANQSDMVNFLKEELDDLRQEILLNEEAEGEVGFFGRKDDRHQSHIDSILDQALELIAPTTFFTWSAALEAVEASEADALSLQGELKLELIYADASDGVGMVNRLLGREFEKGSKEDIEARLLETSSALGQLSSDRDDIINGFADDMLQEHGIELSFSASRALLYSANGAQIIETRVVLESLVEIEVQLKTLIESGVDVETQMTYAGISAVTRLVQARMLQNHILKYDVEWLPRLQELRSETEKLARTTQLDSSRVTLESAQRTLTNNVEIQSNILEYVDRYEAMLLRRRDLTVEALAVAQERAVVAVNTLLTLELARGFTDLVVVSTEEYSDIMAVELPELSQLDPEEMEEMLSISRKLGS